MDVDKYTAGNGVQADGRVDPSKVSPVPVLRGCNAELFEVKVFDPHGKLKYIIPREEIIARERKKKKSLTV